MEDRRNIIIAVLLTGLILFGWPYIVEKFFPETIEQSAPATAKGGEKGTTATGEIAAPDANIAAPAAGRTVPLAQAIKAAPRLIVETPKLRGSVNLQGARIDDLVLLTHRTELAKDSAPVRLFNPSGTKNAYFARFGWAISGVATPDDKSIWAADGDRLTPKTPVTLSWSNESGQNFRIRLSIDENYLITAEQTVINAGTAPVAAAPYGLISRTGKSVDQDTWNIHAGPMGVFNDKADYDWDYDDVAENPGGEVAFRTTDGWLGFTDKYWLAALIPDQKTPVNAKFRASGDIYQSQMVSASAKTVAPGESFAQTSRLFAGAKEVEVLDDYVDQYGIAKLDYAIDWGWFRVIEKLFFKLLHWMFGAFGNFGVAIIGLTIIVRLFMFPVAQRQFSSMAAMRVVQPKMKALQERYKDDKAKLQQEMMQLYKDEKVNPLAGCLPILLQIPIFFSLYKLLLLTIEMRHQPFALWIHDLSAPDPSAHILWDALGTGITLPAFLAIGVLPILLGVTMWLMQKLNPQPMDDVQKQIFGIMPWFLMFIMAPFAAGLQLYWVFSNVISIAQQKWLYSRHPILRQQAEKAAK